ncbi:MAG: DNA polymerase/3'-5' exonuclease PolX [Candidatus Krumholzibacteriia bacterium]
MKKDSKAARRKPPATRKILISKTEIAAILDDMAGLLEIAGANVFKIRAFTNAARELENLPGDLAQMVASGELLDVQGIGKGIFAHIEEMLETGTFTEFEELRAGMPEGLPGMLRVPGIGPRKVKTLHEEIGIKSVEELELAAQTGQIADLPGFGEKSQEKILSGIDRMRRYARRHLLSAAAESAAPVFERISTHPGVQRSLLGGSLRRRKETVKDIDILVSADESEAIMDTFTSLPGVVSVVARGSTKSSVVLESGINVDLRVVGDEEFPFAALYFTGSKEHNTDMRSRAKKMGYKLNEYGLFRDDKPTPCKDERAVFEKLGLDFIPPELRESMGEIPAAENHALPDLVGEGDIKGVFHAHTTYSDGAGTIREMAEGAKALGLEYLGVADHNRSAHYDGGLTVAKAREQAREIAELNESLEGFRVFHGVEPDILPDGALDFPQDGLAIFDYVVASVHKEFDMGEALMTRRVIKAIENPHTTVLGHPTGRILLEHNAYRIDVNAVIDAAAENGVMIEINAHPSRLDLDWRYVRSARDRGVRLMIGPDAHSVEELDFFRYGVGVARKGWLVAADLMNTLGAHEVKTLLQSRRKR